MIYIQKTGVHSLSPVLQKLFDGQRSGISIPRTSQNALSERLYHDQHGKCYICERALCTDIQIEHLCPKSRLEMRHTDWDNLFVSCSYCNSLKNNKYTGLINPCKQDPLSMIRQKVVFDKDLFIFTSSDPTNISQIQTTQLLTEIFNDISNTKAVKKVNFHRYVMNRMNDFRNLCLRYIAHPNSIGRQAIADLLRSESEFLGFKYWMLVDDFRLTEVFSKELSDISSRALAS